MASASERNRRALAKNIRERKQKEARAVIRERERVLKNPKSTAGQRAYSRKRITQARNVIAGAVDIERASQWSAYTRVIGPTARTGENARQFLSGFATMGARRIPNRNGGFLSSREQQKDRDDFKRWVKRRELYMDVPPSQRVYRLDDTFWGLWREQYADTYL